MSEDEFDEVVESTLAKVREMLIVKGREYRREGNPFHNFEKGSKKSGLSRERVLDGFVLKHEVSVSDMIDDLDKGILPSLAAVEEKFGDILVYTLIKKASLVDRINTRSTSVESRNHKIN